MGAFCCRARRAYEPDSDEELLSWECHGCGHQCLDCGERACIREREGHLGHWCAPCIVRWYLDRYDS